VDRFSTSGVVCAPSTPTPSPTPTPTATPSPTLTATLTPTATPTPTATLTIIGPDIVTCNCGGPVRDAQTITLRAAPGPPPGGTFRWEILAGADRVRLSRSRGETTEVRGLSPGSRVENDVVIGLTYVSGQMTLSTTHLLTVLRPSSLNWKLTEQLPLELVPPRPGSPPWACGYYRQMVYEVLDQWGRTIALELRANERLRLVRPVPKERPPNLAPVREVLTDAGGVWVDHLWLARDDASRCPITATWRYLQTITVENCVVRVNLNEYGPTDVTVTQLE
jgi:hypothetical protein